MKRLIGTLLHLANANPPFLAREEFYCLKTRLLRRYGQRAGMDIQHLVDQCWSCSGTGTFTHASGDKEGCWKCNGSGVYRQRWVKLERWTLGGRVFHVPVCETTEVRVHAAWEVTIEGRIQHRYYRHRQPEEAALWLFLLFDQRAFCRMFGCYGAEKIRTPLLALSTAVFWTLAYARRLKGMITRWAIHADGGEGLPF